MSSNILLLEHLNLNVHPLALPDARSFFLENLGFMEDPRPRERGRESSLFWANAGLTQIHLPVVEGPCQLVDGVIGVRVKGRKALDREHLHCLGNTYLLVNDELDIDEDLCRAGARPHPCLLDTARSSTHQSTGLAFVRVKVLEAAIPKIQSFFENVLGARTERRVGRLRVMVDGVSASARGSQYIEFIAVPEGYTFLPYSGWHAAIYLRDFAGAWDAAKRGGWLYDNPRFSDRVGTWEQALHHGQFRTLALGDSGVDLELEIRSVGHSHCPLPPPPPPPPPFPPGPSPPSPPGLCPLGERAAPPPLPGVGWGGGPP